MTGARQASPAESYANEASPQRRTIASSPARISSAETHVPFTIIPPASAGSQRRAADLRRAARFISIHFRAGHLDDLRPARDLAAQEFAECFRRIPVGGIQAERI